MSKFKVGDRIKPIATEETALLAHWNRYWRKTEGEYDGSFVVIRNIDSHSLEYSVTLDGNGPIGDVSWFVPAYTSCAAAEVDNMADEYGVPKAKFKKGDRVRYTTTRPHYSAEPYGGELIIEKIGGGDWGDDVDLIYAEYPRGHYTQIARLVDIEHVATPATALRIEAGKFYKTRDGRKVGPMQIAYGRGSEWAWELGSTNELDGIGAAWRADGTFAIPPKETHPADLIAEWTDEPVAKFKVGDRVARPGFLDGTIVSIDGANARIDYGAHWGIWIWSLNEIDHYPRQATAEPLPTTATAPTNKAIVALIEYGQPKPSARPHVHANVDLATKEAERLAGKHRGQEFGVYELVATRKEAQIVYPFAWQNKAVQGQLISAIKQLRADTGLGLKTAKDAVESWLAAVAA